MKRLLRIEAVPPGEAPQWVREQWVGLALPLAGRQSSPRSVLTSGVMSGPKSLWASLAALISGKLVRRTGYVVETSAAVAILATKSPEAAAWWRENTPWLGRPGRYFVSPYEVGRVMEAP
jgi:hypothetical protein